MNDPTTLAARLLDLKKEFLQTELPSAFEAANLMGVAARELASMWTKESRYLVHFAKGTTKEYSVDTSRDIVVSLPMVLSQVEISGVIFENLGTCNLIDDPRADYSITLLEPMTRV
jgi:hypothetical protein